LLNLFSESDICKDSKALVNASVLTTIGGAGWGLVVSFFSVDGVCQLLII
jgi:hypothetical protein